MPISRQPRDPLDLVRVDETLIAPRHVVIKAFDMDDGPDVELLVELKGGRYVAVEVKATESKNGPVTTEGLRMIRVASLTKWAAQFVQTYVYEPETGNLRMDDNAVPSDEDVAFVNEYGLCGRTLEIVARTYRIGALVDGKPTKTVEDWLEIPRSTAGRWIAAARKKGLLPMSDGPGKATS